MAQRIRGKNPKTGAPWGAATGIPGAVKSMPKHYFMGTTSASKEPRTENVENTITGKTQDDERIGTGS